MSHFKRIAEGIDTAPLLAQLDAQPGLWNQFADRRGCDSPHRETSDLWLRYMPPDQIPGHDSSQPHVSVWYPAFHQLPELWPVVAGFLHALQPIRSGGMMMTKIPAGRQVYPHHDRGSWHSEYFTTKVWCVLRGNDRCINTVEDESIVWKPGEAWSHDNLIEHSVRNEGDSERICLIMCFRCAP